MDEASQSYPSVKLSNEYGIIASHFYGDKYDFKMVQIHILCIKLRVVCTLTVVHGTCSALQHGLVLNHPLNQIILKNDVSNPYCFLVKPRFCKQVQSLSIFSQRSLRVCLQSSGRQCNVITPLSYGVDFAHFTAVILFLSP